jgi:tRNA-Thr(GGU) m(6)t(6)A37 methyltransferase TsaA
MNQSQSSPAEPDSQIIQLKPVGIIRNQSKDPSWGDTLSKLDWQERAARMKEQRDSVSEIAIDAGLDGILDGIEDFSHIMVLYWAHLAPVERRSVRKVHPFGNKDIPLVGVFATHSPVRPNPVLATVVRLIERRGNILKVTGLDALDGSPVLDIKPYQPYREQGEIRVPEWMKKIHDKFTHDENPGCSG